ncbi:MAG: hypothetical protein ACR2OA_06390 [Rubripirellula sp.]
MKNKIQPASLCRIEAQPIARVSHEKAQSNVPTPYYQSHAAFWAW